MTKTTYLDGFEDGVNKAMDVVIKWSNDRDNDPIDYQLIVNIEELLDNE